MAQYIAFLGTGGTIAGASERGHDNVAYRAGQLHLQQLLVQLPGLTPALGGRSFLLEQVFQEDGKDMDAEHWCILAKRVAHFLTRPDVAGLVVTHGTDTLEETAYFLSRVLPAPLLRAKPVVLTCAMRPASSLALDGPQNMRDATCLASTLGACGVLVVCSGQVYGARSVQKVHPYRLDAFSGGESGPVGALEEGRFRSFQPWPAMEICAQVPGLDFDQLNAMPVYWPRVEILMNHAGASGAIVRALCQRPQGSDPPLRGIVVAGTGNGTIHRSLRASLVEAERQGVAILRSTRCPLGQVVVSADESQTDFPASPLSAVKARIEMALTLAARVD